MIGAMFAMMKASIAVPATRPAEACAAPHGSRGSTPAMIAMRLISSEMPWMKSRAKPIDDEGLARPDQQPAEIRGGFADPVGFHHARPSFPQHQHAEGQQHADMAEELDRMAQRLRQMVGHDVDANMLVPLQRIGRGQHEGRAEQIPLQLEPGVGREVENLAHGRVAGADQDRGQDQPMTTRPMKALMRSIPRLRASRAFMLGFPPLTADLVFVCRAERHGIARAMPGRSSPECAVFRVSSSALT